MGIRKLAHYSIRTRNLDASRRFYTELLGFRVGFRPPFGFPGLWLYLGDDESEHGVVHIIGVGGPKGNAVDAYLAERGEGPGGGALDHIAFLAEDWPKLRSRCERMGVAYVERTVPLLGLHQVFISDPSGVIVELNYPAREGGGVAEAA